MAVPVHFSHIMVPDTSAKVRAQKYERNFTSGKLEILYSGNFLETICWEISWKLYAGNLLMKTMCWEVRVDTDGFLMGVIMGQCYGIILRFQGNGNWSSVEHPKARPRWVSATASKQRIRL